MKVKRKKLRRLVLFLILLLGLVPNIIQTINKYQDNLVYEEYLAKKEKLEQELVDLENEATQLYFATRSGDEWDSLIEEANITLAELLEKIELKKEELAEITQSLDEIKAFLE